MVLHIAFDGIDGVGKTTLIENLQNFLSKKQYNVRVAIQPSQKPIISILNNMDLCNHEIALLMAVDRSLTYYDADWHQYDIVLWDRSILSSYAYNTDKNTPKTFIKQINRYFPLMDLYIIIEHETLLDKQDYTNKTDLIEKYELLKNNHKNTTSIKYIKNEPKKMLEETVKILFEKLPTCNWCGRLFTPTQEYKKYCSDNCRKYSLEEQYRINNRNYYHRYKDVMTERQKGQLGSKGANLHGTPDPNPIVELEKLRKHRKAIGLKPFK